MTASNDPLHEPCWKCGGTGKVPFSKVFCTICTACGGSGRLDWISNILRKDGVIEYGISGITGYSGVQGYSGLSGFSAAVGFSGISISEEELIKERGGGKK